MVEETKVLYVLLENLNNQLTPEERDHLFVMGKQEGHGNSGSFPETYTITPSGRELVKVRNDGEAIIMKGVFSQLNVGQVTRLLQHVNDTWNLRVNQTPIGAYGFHSIYEKREGAPPEWIPIVNVIWFGGLNALYKDSGAKALQYISDNDTAWTPEDPFQ